MRTLSSPRAGLLAVPLLLLATRAEAQRATLERQIASRKLPNGLTIIVAENHAIPLATVEVVVRGGASTQAADEQGVPHLFEHMLFRSYRSGGAHSFGEAAARYNAAYNGTTSDEMVTYYATVPSPSTGDAVGLMANLVINPRFREDELKTERSVVMGEFGRRVSDLRGQLHREMERLLWGESFPRKNTIGEVMSLFAANPDRLTSIYHRYYVPNNAAIVVAGDVSTAAVFTEVEKRFADWKPGPDPGAAYPVPPMTPLDSTRVIVMSGDANDITLMMMWQGPRVTTDSIDGYSADVVSEIVNDPDSDFQHRLVDSGLFTSVSMGYQSLEHVGPITLVATTSKEKLDGALTALAVELPRMGSEGYFTDTDLAYAAKRRAVDTALGLETSDGMAETLAYWWAVTGLDHYYGYVDNLGARTTKDLRDYANRYIVGKPYIVGALTPAPDGEVIEQWLRQFVDFNRP